LFGPQSRRNFLRNTSAMGASAASKLEPLLGTVSSGPTGNPIIATLSGGLKCVTSMSRVFEGGRSCLFGAREFGDSPQTKLMRFGAIIHNNVGGLSAEDWTAFSFLEARRREREASRRKNAASAPVSSHPILRYLLTGSRQARSGEGLVLLNSNRRPLWRGAAAEITSPAEVDDLVDGFGALLDGLQRSRQEFWKALQLREGRVLGSGRETVAGELLQQVSGQVWRGGWSALQGAGPLSAVCRHASNFVNHMEAWPESPPVLLRRLHESSGELRQHGIQPRELESEHLVQSMPTTRVRQGVLYLNDMLRKLEMLINEELANRKTIGRPLMRWFKKDYDFLRLQLDAIPQQAKNEHEVKVLRQRTARLLRSLSGRTESR
jgi:hypothetical protein